MGLDFIRSPRVRLVHIHRSDVIENRLHDAPLRFDQILAREKLAIATHGIAQQALIRRHLCCGMALQVQLDILPHHALARNFYAHAKTNADVGADAHAHVRGAHRHDFVERFTRRTLELDDASMQVTGMHFPARI